MNNTEETTQQENKSENSEVAFIGDGNGDDQYLTELQHKFKKVAWQFFYPVWKSKGFRYGGGLFINYVAQLGVGGGLVLCQSMLGIPGFISCNAIGETMRQT